MKELITRWSNESPTFFKKVQKVGISAIAVGTALSMTSGLPAVVVVIAGHLITGGTIATIVGKFAVADPDVLPKK